ncbi:Rad52/Rad22 family DNA repair protein [Phytomonospora sp. NPDC050363]|uniref:Rad52/Rad22 family DNA repair protein n=1 Tax=Phytomonospora sp. NPDC050363 TaxID=3155642 RepID=UPI0033C20440
MVNGLTLEQHAALLERIDSGRVQTLKGMAHLEAWDVRRHLIHIFGLGGYDQEMLECKLVHESSTSKPKKDGQGTYLAHSVIYTVSLRLIVKTPDGAPIAHWDEAASGASMNQPNLGDAHDNAVKTAESQALKRCAVNLGDQFGLSLYNNGSQLPVVKKTLVGPESVAERLFNRVLDSDSGDVLKATWSELRVLRDYGVIAEDKASQLRGHIEARGKELGI